MTTPMMRQFREAKDRYPGMIVLFRNGDFYELFEEDAELGSKLLGITLTRRDKGIPMAGFPHHALENYLQKLLAAGHRAAVCDQLESAAQAKGIIRRDVTRVVTPGTVTEDELLDPLRPNHLVAIQPDKSGYFGLAWVDVSCGAFFAADVAANRLADEISRLAPAECLVADDLFGRVDALVGSILPRPLVGRPNWTFDSVTALDTLRQHFSVSTFAGFGFVDDQPALIAAGALVLYLRETLMAKLGHITRLLPYQSECVLLLDEVTRRSLELTRTYRDGSRAGSLLAVIDRTVTAMGARQLHDWLLAPLTDLDAINARLDAVSELAREFQLRSELRDQLGQIHDLNRRAARASTGRASPRDLAEVGKSLALLPGIKATLAKLRTPLVRELDSKLNALPELRDLLTAALVDDPPGRLTEDTLKKHSIIRAGYNAELDSLRDIQTNGKRWLAQYQAKEITRTGIPSLKVGYNEVFGYYIEVTHTHREAIERFVRPGGYERKQTLKNAERYTTPELSEYAEKILTADSRIQQIESELFTQLREHVAAQTPLLFGLAETLAILDVLCGLAELAATRQYARPKMVREPVLELRDSRHPVLDQILPPGTVVPNDVILSAEAGRFWLVTGPNMAGKSTLLRQAALLCLMAQMGSFVPAKSATIGLVDRIFTRVGASDELARGQSTFMVEMTEAANILNNATSRSLVILDEIGRGTSTFDGVSLAWAITEYLHDVIGCRALFATHYHELARLSESLPYLRNYHVRVQEEGGVVTFLHKIAAGATLKSYGIHVARLAGVPASVIARASEVLVGLESKHQLPAPNQVPVPNATAVPPRRKKSVSTGPSLFAVEPPESS